MEKKGFRIFSKFLHYYLSKQTIYLQEGLLYRKEWIILGTNYQMQQSTNLEFCDVLQKDKILSNLKSLGITVCFEIG